MESHFVIWGMKLVPDACVLDELKGINEQWKLLEGLPQSGSYPKNVSFYMNPEFPNNTIMTDSLRNTDMLIVGSTRLAQFLQKRSVEGIEYLPVNIVNHKKKVVSRDYFIIHAIEPIECLDFAKSGARWSKIDKETVDEVKKLVINEKRISPTRELFRPKSFYRVVLVKRELAQAIDSEGFTGIRWIELENYSS